MIVPKTLHALATVALLAIVASGCAGPTIRGVESTNDYSARFVDGEGEHIASVNIAGGTHTASADGMTAFSTQIAHRQGTTIDSIEIEFLPGLFTPVYLEPPNTWHEGMEYVMRDGVATLHVPELRDVWAESTVVYNFVVPSQAVSEESSGLPIMVRFTLDGTEAMAQFNVHWPHAVVVR